MLKASPQAYFRSYVAIDIFVTVVGRRSLFTYECVQVDRKLVKQTVMTSVYGVTFIGARLQILNRLKERCPIAVDPVETYRAAGYAAKVRPLFQLYTMDCTKS